MRCCCCCFSTARNCNDSKCPKSETLVVGSVVFVVQALVIKIDRINTDLSFEHWTQLPFTFQVNAPFLRTFFAFVFIIGQFGCS